MAVSSSMLPLREGLAEVVSRTDQHEQALTSMETRFAEHLAARDETDNRVSARLEALQSQMTDLQKASSPAGSPGGRNAGQHAVPPTSPTARNSPPSLQMVLGGWRDGERKDYLETELNKLWSAAGVASSVSEGGSDLWEEAPLCEGHLGAS